MRATRTACSVPPHSDPGPDGKASDHSGSEFLRSSNGCCLKWIRKNHKRQHLFISPENPGAQNRQRPCGLMVGNPKYAAPSGPKEPVWGSICMLRVMSSCNQSRSLCPRGAASTRRRKVPCRSAEPEAASPHKPVFWSKYPPPTPLQPLRSTRSAPQCRSSRRYQSPPAQRSLHTSCSC